MARDTRDGGNATRLVRGVGIGVAVVLVGAGLALSRVPGGPGGLLSGDPGTCEDPTSWDDGRQAAGGAAAVAGPVANATYEHDVQGSPTFLNLGNAYPDPDRFDVVIFPDVREQWPGRPEEDVDGERVCVRGDVDVREGVPQIVLDDPKDLVILPESAKAP